MLPIFNNLPTNFPEDKDQNEEQNEDNAPSSCLRALGRKPSCLALDFNTH